MNHVNVSRSCELDNALVGPRCRLEARRAGSVALGRSWSWETTLSGTLNVTRNVESSLEREAASCLAVLNWKTSLSGCFSSRVVCLFCACFVSFVYILSSRKLLKLLLHFVAIWFDISVVFFNAL